MKRGSQFFVSFGVGKWDKNTLRSMFNQFEDVVRQPDHKHKLVIYSDGNDDYTTVLPEYYNTDVLQYGQKIKSMNGKKVFPAIKRKVFGNPSFDDIDTNINESFNSILRGKLTRFVRRTKAHTKKTTSLKNALSLFQFAWNFMHEISEKVTPAICEHQATKIWTWGNLLHAKLSYMH